MKELFALALLWALRPECVDYSRTPEQAQLPLFAMGANARQASRGVGEQMVADEVEWLGRKKEELLAAYDAGAPSRLRTFDQVEEFWAAEVKPPVGRSGKFQKIGRRIEAAFAQGFGRLRLTQDS